MTIRLSDTRQAVIEMATQLSELRASVKLADEITDLGDDLALEAVLEEMRQIDARLFALRMKIGKAMA